MKRLFEKRETSIFLMLVALCVMLTAYSANFLTRTNILNILISNTPLAIISIGMTLVIITGGIDVSVASQMMVSATVIAHFAFLPMANVVTVTLLALLCGLVTGSINGFLISKFNISPIVITLGTSSIYRGLILIFTNGKWVMNLPKWFIAIGKPASGFPLTILYAAIIFVIMACVLRFTSFGRSIYAYGGNIEASKRAGINIQRTIFLTYTYCGMLCGIAGLLLNSILGNYQPTGGGGMEMSAIAAVVIGGTNILGGYGSMAGTAIGVVLMGVIENGLVVAHVPTYYQKMVYGLIIIITVSLDILRKNNVESKQQLIEIDE